MPRTFALLIVFLLFSSALAQKRLELNKFGLVRHKVEKIYVGDILEYKIRGEKNFRKNTILNLHDSTIAFEGGTEIRLSQIKAIRLGKSNHLIEAFQVFFVGGGVMFFVLNAVNNLLLETVPVITQNAVIISLSLVATGVLIKQLGIRRERITKNKVLRIVDINFENLNSK